MYSTTEEFTAAVQANIEKSMTLANIDFASAERLGALNLNTARAVLDDAVASAKALLGAKDTQELVSLQAALAQSAFEKLVAYSRSAYEIASQTNEEISTVIDAQLAEIRNNVTTHLDNASKNGPAGSDVAVAAVKSAIAAANSAYESMSKAAKQVAEIAEANMAAATTATCFAALLIDS